MGGSRRRSRSRDSRRRKSRSRSRSRSRDRSYKRSHRKRSRSSSRSRRRDRKDYKRRSRSLSRSRKRSRSRSKKRGHSSHRYERSESSEIRKIDGMSEEEKDSRTVYIWQLSLRVRTKDLENFFAPCGKMDVVRLVLDNKTGKSRGVAFIQFRSPDCVSKALDLNGQRLLGVPIQVRTVSSEKCRQAEGSVNSSFIYYRGPTKLCVSNLHPQISEQMIDEIFAPYGKLDEVVLMKDSKGDSLGTAYLVYRKGECAKSVVEQMNDFSLAGQTLKITPVIEDGVVPNLGEGANLSATERSELMAKLAVGAGLPIIPTSTSLPVAPPVQQQLPNQSTGPVVNSQCFVLSNMYDTNEFVDDAFAKEIQDDVVAECNQFGGVYHVHVDRKSHKGEVYVKCPSIYVANKCVSTLHGRSFDGRLITANYIPLDYYHKMFPESISVKKLIQIED